MSAIIYLNGTQVDPKDIEGEGGLSVTITVEDEETGEQKKSASGSLTFFGQAYDIIRTNLIEPDDGRLREVPFEIFDDCSTPPLSVFVGVVRGDTVGWCEGECSATGTAIEKTVSTDAADCLKSTLIFDNRNGFQEQAHPRMKYCDELRPGWLHHVILIFGALLVTIITVLIPVVAVISVIINIINNIIDVINSIPGVDLDHIDFDGNSDTDTLEEWQNLRATLIDTIIGCGRVHPSPLLRSYIENACSICGLSFSSSILNNPASDYYDTVLWSAPVEKGTREDSNTYLYENRPIETLDSLMKKLAPVFNAGRRIVGSTLHFERKDMLPQQGQWIDPAVLKTEGRLVDTVCYEWGKDEPHAFAHIGFQQDAVDGPGNEARFFYDRTVEWNQPFNSAQRGELKEPFSFGMLRNRRDGIGGDILDSYLFFPPFSGAINEHGNVMMLERGIGSLPKLLVWDRASQTFGVVKRFSVPGYYKEPEENYNFPFHVTEFNVDPSTGYPTTEPNMSLYGRFHAVRNPKVFSTRGLEFKFTFEYSAAHLASLNPLATIPTPYGAGRITSITINFSERTILVAGKV